MTIFRGEELIFRRERSCETVAAELEAAAVRREAAIAAGVRADPPDPVEQVRVHRAERAGDPDLVIEATGSDAGLRLALDLVRDGGEVILRPGRRAGRWTTGLRTGPIRRFRT